MRAARAARLDARHVTHFAEDLWASRFRDPAEASARAKAVLDAGECTDGVATAWAGLTIGYYHLFFTIQAPDARPLAAARAVAVCRSAGKTR